MSTARDDRRVKELPRTAARAGLRLVASAEDLPTIDGWLDRLYAACASGDLRAPSRLGVRRVDDLVSRGERGALDRLLRRLDVDRLNAAGATAVLCATYPVVGWLDAAPPVREKLRGRLRALGREDILRDLGG